jgi:hypothetical protein
MANVGLTLTGSVPGQGLEILMCRPTRGPVEGRARDRTVDVQNIISPHTDPVSGHDRRASHLAWVLAGLVAGAEPLRPTAYSCNCSVAECSDPTAGQFAAWGG